MRWDLGGIASFCHEAVNYRRRRRCLNARILARVLMDSRRRGAAAEQLAAEHLQRHGLEVIARNLRCRGGEIDLVCLDGGVLAIVEVRQRGRADFGGALASVDRRKQRKIIRAARFFWQRRAPWRACAMRFDVVGVQGLPDGPHRIVWLKDAFRTT
ncbi:MAG: YraN family protein [Steroidobacteraceae bacterium]